MTTLLYSPQFTAFVRQCVGGPCERRQTWEYWSLEDGGGDRVCSVCSNIGRTPGDLSLAPDS